MIIFTDEPSDMNFWLSNYYPFTIGHFSCVQYAYFAAGCEKENDREKLQWITNPRDARRIYKKAVKKPGWDEIKMPVFCGLVSMKFKNDPFQSKLLETAGKFIVYEPAAKFPEKEMDYLPTYLLKIRDSLLRGENI